MVTVTAPKSGATVIGAIAVHAKLSKFGSLTVVGVQFKLDGVNLGAEDANSPYQVRWDSAAGANGSHTLTAVARDTAGKTYTSAPVTVTVNNAAPDTTPPSVSISAPAGGATLPGTVTVSARATDNGGV